MLLSLWVMAVVLEKFFLRRVTELFSSLNHKDNLLILKMKTFKSTIASKETSSL